MKKKVCIIASSYRKNGNSNTLAKMFANGAIDGGNDVKIIYLRNKRIDFCKGCMACQLSGECIIKDDAVNIARKMKSSDVIVFATPVYYYSVSGQLKTLIDRVNSLYGSDYKFEDVYLLASAAEDEAYTVDGAKVAIQGFVDCYERATFKQTIFAGGVSDVGDITGHKALDEAYLAGKNV